MLTTDYIVAVKRRAAVPTAQVTFSTTDFYQLGDEEIQSKLTPLILKCMQEYYVRIDDQGITANQAGYLIPSRSIAGALRNVQIIDPINSDNRAELPRLSPEDLYSSASGEGNLVIRKSGFYLQGSQVILYPTPTTTQNLLRLSYYCRPNSLVDPSACALVQSIDFTNKQITVTGVPSTFSTSAALDFVKTNPGFECSAIDQTPTGISGTTITFGSALPTDLSVGDYLCLAGQTCVLQVPVELQPLLIQYVVVRVLSAQGDAQMLQAAIQELTKLEENALLLISPRVAGKGKRVVNGRSLSRYV